MDKSHNAIELKNHNEIIFEINKYSAMLDSCCYKPLKGERQARVSGDTLLYGLVYFELIEYKNSLDLFTNSAKNLFDFVEREKSINFNYLLSANNSYQFMINCKNHLLSTINSSEILLNSDEVIKQDSLIIKKSWEIKDSTDSLIWKSNKLLKNTDSIIRILNFENAIKLVISGIYISDHLFGAGVSYISSSYYIIGFDFLMQTKSNNAGIENAPTDNNFGTNILFGLKYKQFFLASGFSYLKIKEFNTSVQDFNKVSKISWNANIFYYYKNYGLGIIHSPLYGSGIRICYLF